MLPQVQKILQVSLWMNFFYKWPLDDVKELSFEVKCQKLLKNKFFVLFSIFFKPTANFLAFLGVMESTATTLFISCYIITLCLYHLILPIFEKTGSS